MDNWDKIILGITAIDVADFAGLLNTYITNDIVMNIGYVLTIFFMIDVIIQIRRNPKLNLTLVWNIFCIFLALTPVGFLRSLRFIKYLKLAKHVKHISTFTRLVNGVFFAKDLHKMFFKNKK